MQVIINHVDFRIFVFYFLESFITTLISIISAKSYKILQPRTSRQKRSLRLYSDDPSFISPDSILEHNYFQESTSSLPISNSENGLTLDINLDGEKISINLESVDLAHQNIKIK